MAKIATLIDDFEDGVISPSLWTADSGIQEVSGKLTIPATTSTPICRSINLYDATESSLRVHIATFTNTGSSGTISCGMYLRADANNGVSIQKTPSSIIGQKQVGGTYTTLFTFAHDATIVYWRFRETSGIFYWETSRNGTTWTVQFSTNTATNLFNLTSCWFAMYASMGVPEGIPGSFSLNSVNAGQTITAAASSTSSGSATLALNHSLTASAASTSSGSANLQIHAASVFSLTASGSSTSSGTAMIYRLSPGQITASGQSYSSGSATFTVQLSLTGTAQSYSTGTVTLSVIAAPIDPAITQYFYFEPPVVYDNPTTLPPPFPQIRNSWAKWQKPQPRGRSVLRTGNVCQVIDTPTVDQTLSADRYYAGGHIYVIDSNEANLLSACGLTVTPIPVNWTFYPGEDIFPQTDIFPGYQDIAPPS